MAMPLKKIVFIIIGVVVILIGAIQLFVLSSTKPHPLTIDEFTAIEFDDFNAYRNGNDSLTLSLKKETTVICCKPSGFKVFCNELNAGTLLIESDVNHDSLVTYNELRQSIQKIDSDKDGVINDNERKNYLQQYKIEITNTKMYGSGQPLPYRLDYNPLKKVRKK